jgi:hypothetical protein
MFVMVGVLIVQRMVGDMSVLLFAAVMVVAMKVMAMFAVHVLVRVMSLAMMDILWRRRISRGDGGRATRTGRCAAARHVFSSSERGGRPRCGQAGHESRGE